MKKLLLLPLVVATFFSCESSNETKLEQKSTETKVEVTYPINPKVETKYGSIGNYTTEDQYYMLNGKKVYHGYRKNFYPSGVPKIVSYYEHGTLKWTERYNELGTLIESNKNK